MRSYQPEDYLDDVEVRIDSWNKDFQCLTEGHRFTVVSCGPDGVPSEDDIMNQTKRR